MQQTSDTSSTSTRITLNNCTLAFSVVLKPSCRVMLSDCKRATYAKRSMNRIAGSTICVYEQTVIHMHVHTHVHTYVHYTHTYIQQVHIILCIYAHCICLVEIVLYILYKPVPNPCVAFLHFLLILPPNHHILPVIHIKTS